MTSETRSHTEIEAMDAPTLKALRGSIKKWQRIAAGKGFDRGGENCPLCVMFAIRNGSCNGCPVKNKIGAGDCFGNALHALAPN